jgi:hypothetical protein
MDDTHSPYLSGGARRLTGRGLFTGLSGVTGIEFLEALSTVWRLLPVSWSCSTGTVTSTSWGVASDTCEGTEIPIGEGCGPEALWTGLWLQTLLRWNIARYRL